MELCKAVNKSFQGLFFSPQSGFPCIQNLPGYLTDHDFMVQPNVFSQLCKIKNSVSLQFFHNAFILPKFKVLYDLLRSQHMNRLFSFGDPTTLCIQLEGRRNRQIAIFVYFFFFSFSFSFSILHSHKYRNKGIKASMGSKEGIFGKVQPLLLSILVLGWELASIYQIMHIKWVQVNLFRQKPRILEGKENKNVFN